MNLAEKERVLNYYLNKYMELISLGDNCNASEYYGKYIIEKYNLKEEELYETKKQNY